MSDLTITDEDLELDLVLEVLQRRYGYDFRGYVRASLRRRLAAALERRDLDRLVDLVPPLMRDADFCLALLDEITTPFTEMFRDPGFFVSFRERVVPVLETHPRPRIWIAGCAAGHEAYSLAILLEEEGLYDRCTLLASDINRRALERAREGVYPVEEGRRFSENYVAAGGKRSPGDYYHAAYSSIRLDEGLRRNVSFFEHNLVQDEGLGEVDAVLCRNVLIYFDKTLQEHVLRSLAQCLSTRGHLCLGKQESLEALPSGASFEVVDRENRIFRKGIAA